MSGMKSLAACAMSLIVAAAPVGAVEPAPPTLSVPLALEAAQAALDSCLASGFHPAIAVVDNFGVQRVMLLAQGASLHAVSFAQRKATAAAIFGMDSSELKVAAKNDMMMAVRLWSDPSMIPYGGAAVFKSKGVVIGALGVSGTPGGGTDLPCMKAGYDKVKNRL